MDRPTKKEFEKLAEVNGSRCLSIYIPTHKEGHEVLEGQDQIKFKNIIAHVEKELENRGFDERGNEEFLKPLRDLLKDQTFWRYQSHGLAVFLTRDYFKYYTIPVQFEEFWHLSTEFYLKPLLPYLMENHRFYLLTLNLHDVNFYKGDKYGIEELYLEGTIPQRLEEVVGFDYREKFLNFRKQRGGQPQAIFHGHGSWKEDEKDEILTYFRAIDSAVTEYLNGAIAPLVVVSLDYLFPLYQQANTYVSLFPEHISKNPQDLSTEEIHKMAWELLSPEFSKTRTEKEELLRQFQNTKRTSTDIRLIMPAALGGRIDTLFLSQDYEEWGVYHEKDASVDIQDEHHRSNASLVNQAAIAVFRNGGRVYIDEKENLPLKDSEIQALNRY